MGAKTKKIKSAGRFRAGYGSSVKSRLVAVEIHQRKKQSCLFCSKFTLRRKAMGIWHCLRCGKNFAGGAYVPQPSK